MSTLVHNSTQVATGRRSPCSHCAGTADRARPPLRRAACWQVGLCLQQRLPAHPSAVLVPAHRHLPRGSLRRWAAAPGPGACACRLTDEDYSDDEDASWKVRRAAAKLVAAVIVSQPELLPTIYPQAAPALVQRFREREENVKTDVFSAFVDLVHMVRHPLHAAWVCISPHQAA